ncbi:hypothetical protein PFISCL1PPCAC_29240, partial [Pristionchus fissidentatus]
QVDQTRLIEWMRYCLYSLSFLSLRPLQPPRKCPSHCGRSKLNETTTYPFSRSALLPSASRRGSHSASRPPSTTLNAAVTIVACDCSHLPSSSSVQSFFLFSFALLLVSCESVGIRRGESTNTYGRTKDRAETFEIRPQVTFIYRTPRVQNRQSNCDRSFSAIVGIKPFLD